jgi:RimJ/RimL family protein N-acetyltransferase
LADKLVYSTGRVFAFVSGLVPMNAVAGMVGIGLERDGELIAGVIYEGFNGKNIWMHVAAVPGKRWLVRSYLKACFVYPFVQCGVDRVSGYVNASNLEARRFDEHLGFKEEATLQGAAADGGDVIIYVMRKKGCRYVDSK